MRGKGHIGYRVHNDVEDHPRVCGEKAAKYKVINGDIGSPPRVRGKVNCVPFPLIVV